MTFLVSMLNSKVTPLEDRQPSRTEVVKNKVKRPKDQSKNIARHNEAIARFKAAMPLEWNTTSDIAAALDKPPTSVIVTLKKWHVQGKVDRRIAGDWASAKTAGYEWRMK